MWSKCNRTKKMAHLIWEKKTHLEVKTVKKIFKKWKKEKETLTSQESATVGNKSSPEVQRNTVLTTARSRWAKWLHGRLLTIIYSGLAPYAMKHIPQIVRYTRKQV